MTNIPLPGDMYLLFLIDPFGSNSNNSREVRIALSESDITTNNLYRASSYDIYESRFSGNILWSVSEETKK
jgi:hypothetical protein